MRHLVGVVGRPNQWATRHVCESKPVAKFSQACEFFGCPIAHHRVMVCSGLQLLTYGYHDHQVIPQIPEGLFNLLIIFAEAQHDA